MNDQELVTFLRERVHLCAHFSNETLERLAHESNVVLYDPHEAILHFNEEVTYLGVVLAGEVAAAVPDEMGHPQNLGTLEAGSTFGEMALMSGVPSLAQIISVSRSTVLQIPLTLFRSVIMTDLRSIQVISNTITDRFKDIIAHPQKAAVAFQRPEASAPLTLKSQRPEKILVINCGSSSVKYTFYDTTDSSRETHGVVERIGAPDMRLVQRRGEKSISQSVPSGGYPEAFDAMMMQLRAKDGGVLKNEHEVTLVVHRVVHGGERFTEGALITPEVEAEIERLASLAPLHNPVNLAGVREMQRIFPDVPHVAVFDTSFHHTLAPYVYLYGLPYDLYERHKVRRYGFHGTSHHYVGIQAAAFLGRRSNDLRIVSCHLGNGASVCAIDHGRSVDTSMGFTPTEGLIMGTRCGDLDPGILGFLERSDGLTLKEREELINKKSGILGMSGVSSDMRELLASATDGHSRAILAMKGYSYRVRKYIGAYIAAMGGIDLVIFTGGVGQGSAEIRALALQGLDCMGITIDEDQNGKARGFHEITRVSKEGSKVTVLVVPTDEERMMAREAVATLERTYLTSVLQVQKQQPIPVEVSAHHVHLMQEHVEMLFGKGHTLTKRADLSQPGQYATEEQVSLVGPKGRIDRVRVLGPARKATQVEIAMTEQFKLGINPPIRESGNVDGTPGCALVGPAGTVALDRGVICALRHIHMTPGEALRYGVRDKSVVRVRIGGDRELIFGDVLVRVDPNFSLAMHIDTDEANAANVEAGAVGHIEGIQSA